MALVIIADPSSNERQRLRAIVEIEDHVIVEADSGAYCLEIAEYHQPQCVMLNEQLPSHDFQKLLQQLNQLSVPAIVIATNAREKSQTWEKIAGVVAVIHSDISQDLILGALRKALDQVEIDADEQDATVASMPDRTSSVSETAKNAVSAVGADAASSDKAAQVLSIDQLQQLAWLGMNEASSTLTDLTGSPLNFQAPSIVTMEAGSLLYLLKGKFGQQQVCAVQLPFAGRLMGTAQLFFNPASAVALAAALTGEEPSALDFATAQEETLTEVGNIVLNSVLGSMSNALTQRLTFEVPLYSEVEIDQLVKGLSEDFNAAILLAQSMFQIPEFDVEGDIILFFKVRLFFDLAADVSA